MENEITVLVTCDYETLINNLNKHGFKVMDEFELDDTYMIDSKIKLEELSNLEILQKCIIVREIPGAKKSLLYKKKEYAPNGDIIKQSKVECAIEDIDNAKRFMEAIDYTTLFRLYAKCTSFSNEKSELLVQLVNDDYILIEQEDKTEYIEKTFNNIEEVKEDLLQYNLPIDKSNFFVKKAEIELRKVLKR